MRDERHEERGNAEATTRGAAACLWGTRRKKQEARTELFGTERQVLPRVQLVRGTWLPSTCQRERASITKN